MDPSLEGAEFELDDPDTWSQLMIEPGMVLEVNLMSTDLFILAETWNCRWMDPSSSLPRLLGAKRTRQQQPLQHDFKEGSRCYIFALLDRV